VLVIKTITASDRGLVSGIIGENWGSSIIVTRGNAYDASLLSGFIAELDGEIAGLITYDINYSGRMGGQLTESTTSPGCEIVTLDSFIENRGVGSRLIEEVLKVARERDCHRLWVITTNDNINAMRFYQKRGFTFAALHVDAVAESRAIKPQIPLIGYDGIPVKDEIEFEIRLDRTFNC
jgi:ribosomal protein S18 acetylase RimI-like enzyme